MNSFYNNVLYPIVKSIGTFRDLNAFCIDEEQYTYAQLSQCISKVRMALQKCNYQNTKVGLVINDGRLLLRAATSQLAVRALFGYM